MRTFSFSQVDVFSPHAMGGNPVAVVHDAGPLTDEQMLAFARWTNLSETTFLLPAEHPDADYRLRIFTPGGELPFAGHPTLGSCHAWRSTRESHRQSGSYVQECAVGLVTIRQDGERLAFAAPPLVRSGPVTSEDFDRVAHALDIDADDIEAMEWVDNGPGWVGVLLDSAEEVLAIEPNPVRLAGLNVGVIGPHPAGSSAAFEVRAFCPTLGMLEDPVTGSLNAGLGQWLIGSGRAPRSYVAAQGTALGRRGEVHVDFDGTDVWVGGITTIRISGTVRFPKEDQQASSS